MKNKIVKYPCRRCIYYKICGDSGRIEPCKGRMTKREKKEKDTKRK